MTICAVEEVPSGCLKISTIGEPSFFIRAEYLSFVSSEKITNLSNLTEDEESDVKEARSAFLAEREALTYIARAEQTRLLLSRKLEAKGFDKCAISKALDRLEEMKILDDSRFAIAWLHTRTAKNEGRLKLLQELCARGVKSETAKYALDEFFIENDEELKCEREYEKLLQKTNDENKIYARLVRLGFSAKMIRHTRDKFYERRR